MLSHAPPSPFLCLTRHPVSLASDHVTTGDLLPDLVEDKVPSAHFRTRLKFCCDVDDICHDVLHLPSSSLPKVKSGGLILTTPSDPQM